MPEFQPLSRESESLCDSILCPECGVVAFVTAERVIEGNQSITRCHCRACGHSWHPQVEPEIQ